MKRPATSGRRVPLVGSDRVAPEGATLIGDVDPDERITIVVHVKRRTPDRFQVGSEGDLNRLAKPVTRRALASQRRRTHGRATARIRKLAAHYGLTVERIDFVARIVVLQGAAWQMAEIFGAMLRIYDDGQCRFRARVGQLLVPAEVAPYVRAILGFDQRPMHAPKPFVRAQAGVGAGAGLWPTQMAALYGIPLDHDVSSVCVGIVALGGGYLASDLTAALTAMDRVPPVVIDVPEGGNDNAYKGGTTSDREIALDLQILAGLLPRAKIVVYFAGDSIDSLTAAIHQAVFDDVHRPQVISVSWGSAEKFWTDTGRDAMQAVLADAARLRVSVLFAAGDELATGGLSDHKVHVWFPASSPYAIGCGGTLPTLTSGAASIATETVWKEGFAGTGGGISDVFPVPAYQSQLVLPPSQNDGKLRRGVPDVACAAASTPGYRIVVGGVEMALDGTSGATPLWAALVAIANAARGEPVGRLNSLLYANPAAFRPITQGDNRVDGKGYEAGPNSAWNACTGLGVPKGADIIAALTAVPVA